MLYNIVVARVDSTVTFWSNSKSCLPALFPIIGFVALMKLFDNVII